MDSRPYANTRSNPIIIYKHGTETSGFVYTKEFDDYLATCTPDADGNCEVPVVFTSASGHDGELTYDLTLKYTTDIPPNQPPIADAGPDITIPDGVDTLLLDASGSYDPDGTIVKYKWDLWNRDLSWDEPGWSIATDYPTHEISGIDTYFLPGNSYEIDLMIMDDQGATATDSFIVTIEAAGQEFCVYGGTEYHANFFTYNPNLEEITDKGTPIKWQQSLRALTTGEDGKVYGGTVSSEGHLFIYDPVTNMLTDAGRPTDDPSVYSLTAGTDGKIYGGTYGHAYLFEYTPSTDTFNTLGEIQGEGAIYSMATGSDGKIYAGTWPNGYFVIYDPSTGTIDTHEVSNEIYAVTALTLGKDGKVYGGTISKPRGLRDVKIFIYDPSTDTITVKDSGIKDRAIWSITTGSDGKIYIGTHDKAHLIIYDPVTDTFTDKGRVIDGALGIYSLTNLNGKVYGGTGSRKTGHLFVYDTASDTIIDKGEVISKEELIRSLTIASCGIQNEIPVASFIHSTKFKEYGSVELGLGPALDIIVYDNYAYATHNKYLNIIDISDSTNPVVVGDYNSGNQYIHTAKVKGQYAYLAAFGNGIIVLDISDPTNPVFIRRTADVRQPALKDLVIKGNYIYAVGYSGSSTTPGQEKGFEIFDISNPTNPKSISLYKKTTRYTSGVDIKDNYAYVADSTKGLLVLDVSNPKNPKLAGQYVTSGKALKVQVKDNYAYVIEGSGLTILDISDPTNPTLEGVYATPYAHDVHVVNNYAYLGEGSKYEVNLLDVSDPSNPTSIQSYVTKGYSYGVYTKGDFTYVFDNWFSTLRIISSEDKTACVGKDSILFDASGSYDPDGEIVTYEWDFGDRTSGTGETITHTYTDAGTYTVTLTVTDNDGATATDEAMVMMLECSTKQPPVADAGPDQEACVGEEVLFDGSGSYDPDGGSIILYRWDFGNGLTKSGEKVTHIFTEAGEYMINLIVMDDEGQQDNDSAMITVIKCTQPCFTPPAEDEDSDSEDIIDMTGTIEESAIVDKKIEKEIVKENKIKERPLRRKISKASPSSVLSQSS